MLARESDGSLKPNEYGLRRTAYIFETIFRFRHKPVICAILSFSL